MKKVSLIEVNNILNNTIRSILTEPDQPTDHLVIGIPGFERNASTEKKFTALSQSLADRGVASLRFDWTGCGLSDGQFDNFTIDSGRQDLATVMNQAVKGYSSFSFVAHSVGACVLAKYFAGNPVENLEAVILLAPAFNQPELIRYYFVKNAYKKDNPVDIIWDNFMDYFDQEEFIKDCTRTDKMSKTGKVNSAYLLSSKDERYRIENHHSVLHIHGDNDDKVPLASLRTKYTNHILVKNGDHDLERIDMIEQWLGRAVEFIV